MTRNADDDDLLGFLGAYTNEYYGHQVARKKTFNIIVL